MKNKVKWFDEGERYGFIEYKNNQDVVIHYFSIKKHEAIKLIKTKKGYKVKKLEYI